MKMNKDLKMELYKTMLTIRRFEEKTAKLYAVGKITGGVHLYIGEEAIATGVCANLTPQDYITSTHRGHGHLIAKGGDVKLMMAELFQKRTGYCKGKGGSMHICDLSLGIFFVTNISEPSCMIGFLKLKRDILLVSPLGAVKRIYELLSASSPARFEVHFRVSVFDKSNTTTTLM